MIASTISSYDISKAVQLKKTRSLTDIEKFNFLNHHFIPPCNLKFPTKQYGYRQRSFQHVWLKNSMAWSTLLMMKVLIVNLCPIWQVQ